MGDVFLWFGLFQPCYRGGGEEMGIWKWAIGFVWLSSVGLAVCVVDYFGVLPLNRRLRRKVRRRSYNDFGSILEKHSV